MSKRLFSIVTVCKNPAGAITETIASLQTQTFRDFEFIVIDGGSTDGTIELLKANPLVTTLVSEKDNGIYDAMNKGIARARGEYIYFLNSGDIFHNATTLEKVARFCRETQADLVFGNTLLIDPKQNTEKVKDHSGVDKFYLFHRPINHQAIFGKKSMFDAVGHFNRDYVVKADHEWIMRCYAGGFKFAHIPIVVTRYLLYGFAFQNRAKFRTREKKRIQNTYFSPGGRFLLRALHRMNITPGGGLRNLLNRVL